MTDTHTAGTLVIDGPNVKLRLGIAAVLIAIGAFLWSLTGTFTLAGAELGNAKYWIMALTAFMLAALVPLNKLEYLDFSDRRVVTVSRYGHVEMSKQSRPFSDFSRIVVRHLFHADHAGPDTYTGDVGLKPADGGKVLWVKSFPATEESVPAPAAEFARKLKEMTGLPLASRGGGGSAMQGDQEPR